MSAALLAVLVGLPLLAGALLCLLPVRRPAPVAVGVAGVVAAAAVVAAVRRPAAGWAFLPLVDGGGVRLAVDDLAAPVLVSVGAVTALVLLAAALDAEAWPARFWGLMLVFTGSVTLTVTATTLPALLLGWEVMGACSYALIGLRWDRPAPVAAGASAFLTTRTTDLGLYVAGGAALAGGAGWSLDRLSSATGPWLHLAAAGVLVAALGKAAQLPFSAWLSRAMEGPAPVSALLHSAAMVAMGGYLLLRTAPLLAATGWAGPTAAWVGAVTTVALGAVAVAQSDLKQLLAASTAAQLGFVVLAAGVSATAAGSAQLVAHAAVKAGLFLAAGAWLTAIGSKQLPALRGIARRFRALGAVASVGLLALAGVPPLSLWLTKDSVLAAAGEQSVPLQLVGLAGALLSAAYAGTALRVLWSRTDPAPGGDEQPPRGRVPTGQLLPLGALAAGAVVLGVLAPGTAGPGELALSGVLAVGVVLLVLRRPVPAPRWAARWLGLQTAADRVVAGLGVLVAGAARAEDLLVRRGVGGITRTVPRLAAAAAAADDRGPAAAVRAVTAGARSLGVLARRPQTGLAHQYYVQAVLALAAVLAAVLLSIVVR
ncbi:proton-conducting transporter membrane subunit [Klenkia sp. PcliD-1-E]|uniref:proton-conducting transporter transmembrane domain-containing protein n=1 Tax=Klenkia sp. PcliD-1-E TaxID=2954492 RepID=UPI00209850E5|nr:proton-conducting transporter membrane subunit [Klenkia sp. PcliD-1-E]MCO7218324.1 NADH-quinone oxidoreductase subunit L [Klenkia sp. PcliD-1-E]